MVSRQYRRGAVVKGPDLVGRGSHRPWVCVTGGAQPFASEEALWVAVSTTPRSEAVELRRSDFETGALPKRSFANPWTVVTIKHADMSGTEGRLADAVTDEISNQAAAYLSPDSVSGRS